MQTEMKESNDLHLKFLHSNGNVSTNNNQSRANTVDRSSIDTINTFTLFKRVDDTTQIDDNFFKTNYDSNWTLNDELRLQAVDDLHTRTLEFHNNVHQKTLVRNRSNIINTIEVPLDSIAFITSIDRQNSTVSKPNKFNYIKFQIELKKIASIQTNSFNWIHITDLTTSLACVIEAFDIHPLCESGFYDLRAHSNTIITREGSLISFCYFIMNKDNGYVSMFKVYIYITNNLIITHEIEIMCDTSIKKQSSNTTASLNTLNRLTQLNKKCYNIGPMYIFYEIITEILSLQDPILEFISRSLFYFKKHINVKLIHREKVLLMKRIHTIESTIAMIRTYYNNNMLVLSRLTNHAMKQETRLLQSLEIASSNHSYDNRIDNKVEISENSSGPYLIDLQDSLRFICQCVENENLEAGRLHEVLDKLNVLRANNASMMLSLVATVFLPVTFLTGVFGMNFSVDGGYTIGLVNQPFGPLVFYMLCVGIFLISMIIFLQRGWLDGYFLIEWLLPVKLFKQSSSLLYKHSQHDEEEWKKSQLEETRRNEEANRKREVQMLLNRQSLTGSRSSIGITDEHVAT